MFAEVYLVASDDDIVNVIFCKRRRIERALDRLKSSRGDSHLLERQLLHAGDIDQSLRNFG